MSKLDDKRRRAKYTLEFKLEAVRLVKGGQDASVTARVLGVPKATLGNWIRAAQQGELHGAGGAHPCDPRRFKGECGWPRVWRELLARGARVGKDRVQRLMKLRGIRARGKRKFVVTTASKHNLPVAENLLARDFTPEAADRVWSSDITYIATDGGWLHLAGMIDLFSRQVVGGSKQLSRAAVCAAQ